MFVASVSSSGVATDVSALFSFVIKVSISGLIAASSWVSYMVLQNSEADPVMYKAVTEWQMPIPVRLQSEGRAFGLGLCSLPPCLFTSGSQEVRFGNAVLAFNMVVAICRIFISGFSIPPHSFWFWDIDLGVLFFMGFLGILRSYCFILTLGTAASSKICDKGKKKNVKFSCLSLSIIASHLTKPNLLSYSNNYPAKIR